MKIILCGGVRKGHRGERIKGEVVAEQDIIAGTKERFEGGGHPFPDLGPWWVTVPPGRGRQGGRKVRVAAGRWALWCWWDFQLEMSSGQW